MYINVEMVCIITMPVLTAQVAVVRRSYTDIYIQWELRTGTDEIDSSILQTSVVDNKRARANTMSGMMRSVVPRMTGM